MRVLERRRRDPGQLNPPHELVSGVNENPQVDEIIGVAQSRKPVSLRLEREEAVGAERLPWIEKGPIAQQDLQERLGVSEFEPAEIDGYLTAYSNGANTECRPASSKLISGVSTFIRSLVAISPSAQMKPPSLTILTLFTSPLTGLRSGVMIASAIPLTDRLELLPSTSRSIATRSTAPGSSKVELKISKNE